MFFVNYFPISGVKVHGTDIHSSRRQDAAPSLNKQIDYYNNYFEKTDN